MERDVIGEWARSLSLPGRRKRAIERELRAHIVEAQQDLEAAGWPAESAARESIRRLGDPGEIAAGFERVYRRPRRLTIGLAVALASALLLGAYGAGGTFASATSAHAHGVHHTHVVQRR